MNNGTLGLSFWLAVAAGIVAFGVSWIIGHAGFLMAAIIGILVFFIVWLVLGYALKGRDNSAPAGTAGAANDPSQAAAEGAASTAAAPSVASAAAANAAPKAAVKTEAAAKPTVAKSAAKPDAKPAAETPAAPKATASKAAASKAAAPKAAAAKAGSAAKPAAAAPATAKTAAPKTPAASDDAPAPGSVGKAPATLKAARNGKADDLKIIEGIGPKLEQLVNSLGFYHYDQIASWTGDEIAWVDSHMKTFRGRIVRDKWVAQAKLIVAEGVPAFLERAKTNNY